MLTGQFKINDYVVYEFEIENNEDGTRTFRAKRIGRDGARYVADIDLPTEARGMIGILQECDNNAVWHKLPKID